jgi:glutamate--cysteine ligase
MSAWLRPRWGRCLRFVGAPALSRRRERVDLREEANLSEPVTPDAELSGIDDLLLPFHSAMKPRAQWRIGTEAEKPGLLGETLAPLPFEGTRSVKRVLALLAERFGWHAEREYERGDIISLKRGEASITLEPAGQLELSGAPLATIHETCAEFDAHLNELQGISEELGIIWLGLGFHPFATLAELPHVPKLRYGVMEKYLPTRGPRALDMMRRTCTVQANMDYDSEDDALRKLRVSLAIQPIVTAMFANSPFYEGRIGQHLDERAAVWLGMDPDRSGLLPFAWEHTMSLRAYVEWALDVPMFLIKRGARVIPNTQQTFRQYMTYGTEGVRATRHDWETHINTLFPEARLKRTLEVRGADAQRHAATCALPALWKGLLYDPHALSQLEALIAPLDAKSVQAARPDIARSALKAMLAGKPVQAWAEQVMDIASGGLERLACRNARGEDERVHLQPIAALLSRGQTPADVLLANVRAAKDFRSGVIEHARL